MNDTDALELDLFHRFLSLFYRKHQKLLFLLLSQKYFQQIDVASLCLSFHQEITVFYIVVL